MNEKIAFAMKFQTISHFRQLCQEHGISTKTGYKWKDRFINNGVAGLEDESRRPQGHAAGLSAAVACEGVTLKQVHLHWGGARRFMFGRPEGGAARPMAGTRGARR